MLSGRIQQRLQVTYADLDNRFHSSFGDSFFETRRTTARAQTDLAAATRRPASRSAWRDWPSARAAPTSPAKQSQPVPIERRTIGAFGEVRQQVGRSRVVDGGRCASTRFDGTRSKAIPSPSRLGPAFAEDTVNSVNPRASGDARRCGRTPAAPRARSCGSARERASVRRTPSRSRSPTTRRSSRSAAAAWTSASASR